MVVLNSSQKASATIYVNPADDSFTKSKLINVGSISDVDHDGLVKLKLVNPLKIEGTSFSVVVEMTSVYTSRTIYSRASSYVSDSLDNEFETFHDLSTSESAVFPITINTDTNNEYYINDKRNLVFE